ncbi:transcription initiation factor IIE alpha subunit [Streptacidiphilus sp. MAP12-33]|uniref:hypothetical protein n=1 Tax=Streptacidiphilus sp. MAP12-33 TaxID=3156266 RepID=UPI003512C98E
MIADAVEDQGHFPTDRDIMERSGMPLDDVRQVLRTLAENEMITDRGEGGHRRVTGVTEVGTVFAREG